jgi:3-methyl-2-oxobutanoate hydroxymethyltransferase
MVWTDWAGFTTGRIPRFVKRYANISETLLEAAVTYRNEVEAGEYPGPEHEYGD